MGLQWKTKAYLEQYKLRRLKSVINFAYKNTRFYKKLYDSNGITPRRIRSIDSISRLPRISKADVVNNYPNNILTNIPTSTHTSTSGSSGEPVEIAFDKSCRNHYDALFARAMFGAGYRLGDKLAFFHWKEKNPNWYERLGIFRKHMLPMAQDNNSLLNKLVRIRPDVVYCFASQFRILFEKMKDTGFYIHPRIVVITGDSLAPTYKREIEEILSCKVLEQYAASEFEIIAWQCRHGGYHINDDSVHLETSESGEILLTSLWNRKMPLIRYSIGDIGKTTSSSCACGRGLSLLGKLDGRKDDIIRISNRQVSPSVLTACIETGDEFYKHIRQYKIVQQGKIITFIYVERIPTDEAFLELIRKRLKTLVGNVNIRFQRKSSFKLSRRGKFKTVEVR